MFVAGVNMEVYASTQHFANSLRFAKTDNNKYLLRISSVFSSSISFQAFALTELQSNWIVAISIRQTGGNKTGNHCTTFQLNANHARNF